MRCNQARCLFSNSLNQIFKQRLPYLIVDGILKNGCRRFHSFQDNRHSWSVLQHIYRKQFKGAHNKKHACFLLNISQDSYDLFTKYHFIWEDASLKIAVDGSANCLAKKGLIHTADVVCGDFDSIDAKLLEKLRFSNEATTQKLLFKSKDHHHHHTSSAPLKLPQIIETPAQRETDFTKAIRVAIAKRPDINFFFGLYHSAGSRIDHLFGLVNTLHLIKRDIIIVNINSNTISWLLVAGNHAIQKPKGREFCSLVPFTGPTEVNTQGLEYNIGNSSATQLSFGGLISTSNICRENCKTINVETNRELLWSIDVSV